MTHIDLPFVFSPWEKIDRPVELSKSSDDLDFSDPEVQRKFQAGLALMGGSGETQEDREAREAKEIAERWDAGPRGTAVRESGGGAFVRLSATDDTEHREAQELAQRWADAETKH